MVSLFEHQWFPHVPTIWTAWVLIYEMCNIPNFGMNSNPTIVCSVVLLDFG